MSNDGGFINDIARDLNISKGINENTANWETRVVYAILGRMSIASLWDKEEDEECGSSNFSSISIIHFKQRINKLLYAYRELCEDIKPLITDDNQQLTDKIYDIYLNTGYFYHSKNRISPVKETRAIVNNIVFVRGNKLCEPISMSGLGFYVESDGQKITTNYDDLLSMFQMQREKLDTYVRHIIFSAQWSVFSTDTRLEYLRLNPPFTRGYWNSTPDTNGEVSLLRVGAGGGQRLYYLYRYENGQCLGCQLPEWQVDKHEYLRIACSLLSSAHMLPAIIYHEDGAIVYVRLGYLLPPSELLFYKLYSWPISYSSIFQDNFNRIMEYNIFNAFKKTLEQIGYNFVKG